MANDKTLKYKITLDLRKVNKKDTINNITRIINAQKGLHPEIRYTKVIIKEQKIMGNIGRKDKLDYTSYRSKMEIPIGIATAGGVLILIIKFLTDAALETYKKIVIPLLKKKLKLEIDERIEG